jgi:hypothetical protein
LVVAMEEFGSPEFELRWSYSAMPVGERLLQRGALARRTAATASSGQQDLLSARPTATAPNGGRNGLRTDEGRKGEMRHLEAAPKVVDPASAWPTPAEADSRSTRNRTANRSEKEKHHDGETLVDAAQTLSAWPTTQARDGDGRGAQEERANGERMNLDDYALLAGWTTPRATDGEKGGPNQTGETLTQHAMLAPWISPRSTEIGRQRSEDALERARQTGGAAALEDQVLLSGWTSPQANEPTSKERPSRAETGRTTEFLGRQVQGLVGQASLASPWGTPASRDGKDAGPAFEANPEMVEVASRLPRQVMKCPDLFGPIPGASPSPSSAETASGDVSPQGARRLNSAWKLNPNFSGWLMGFPIQWDLAALRAILKGSRSRKTASVE